MKKDKFKTVFMGTPDFACPILKALIADENFNIILVVTQKDKKIGRKQVVTAPPIKVVAQKNDIPFIQPGKIKEAKEKLKKIKPDFIVVAAYGQIIPENILDIPKYGPFNVHASLLPKYRGSAVIPAPILNGDKETGVTIIKMDTGIDTGPILYQEKIDIKEYETAQKLHDRLANLGAKILPSALKKYVQKELKLVEQNLSQGNYIKMLKKEDGKIDWNKNAKRIERMIRALNPWPGAYSHFKKSIIKIIEAENETLKINDYKIGEVFLHDKKLAIQCGQNAIAIKKLQLEGKKQVTGEEFLRGQNNFPGSILE